MAHKTIHADYVIHYQIAKTGLSGSAHYRQTNHCTMALPNTQRARTTPKSKSDIVNST